MSKFTTPLKLEFIVEHDFRLLETFEYYREFKNEEVIKVPAGFVSNFASVPRMLWPLFPPTGTKRQRYGKSAILHDWLYDKKCQLQLTRKEADLIFLESMLAVGVSRLVAKLFYYCVRLFARGRFR